MEWLKQWNGNLKEIMNETVLSEERYCSEQ